MQDMNNEIAIVFTTRHLEIENGTLFSGVNPHYAISDEFYSFFMDKDVYSRRGVVDEHSDLRHKKRVAEIKLYLTEAIYFEELQPQWDDVTNSISTAGLELDTEGLSRINSMRKFDICHHETIEKNETIKMRMINYAKAEQICKKKLNEELKLNPKDVIEKLNIFHNHETICNQTFFDVNIDCTRTDLKNKLIQLRFSIYELPQDESYHVYGLWGLGDTCSDMELWYETIQAEIIKNSPNCKYIYLVLHDKDIQREDCSFTVIERLKETGNNVVRSVAIFNHEDRIGRLLKEPQKTSREVGDFIIELFNNN